MRRRLLRLPPTRSFVFAVQRLQLSRFGPRDGRENKRIRSWAEVGFSAELDGARRARTSDRNTWTPIGVH